MEFMTPLESSATEFHELYQAFINAGFTKKQAFALTIEVFKAQAHQRNH